MDARLAKIRERKERKLREAGVVKNTQEQDDKTQEQDDKTQEQDDKTQDISNDNEESGSDEMFIGAMLERIRNKSTKMTHLNEWEKGKVGKNVIIKFVKFDINHTLMYLSAHLLLFFLQRS